MGIQSMEKMYLFIKTHEGGDYNIHKSGNGSNTFVISDDEDEYEHDTKIVIKDNGEKDKVKTIKKI